MVEPEEVEGEEAPGPGPEEPAPDAAEEKPGVAGSGEGTRPPPAAVSVFVTDPEGLPSTLESPFWAALPRVDDFLPLEECAPVRPSTELRVAHDARHLAFHVRCGEPDMGSPWTRRTGRVGRLDLDDSVEILLDPYGHGFAWSLRATPSGERETIIPVGAVAQPDCAVEVRTSEKSWEVLFRIPFVDVGLEGDLRGTPLDGELWGFAVIRRRREAARGKFKGLREVTALAASRPRELAPGAFATLAFQGGRTARPLEFTRYAAGSFGVNEICVAFEGGKIPPGVEAGMKPLPAKKLRSKDASRYKFRVARPGLYRYSVRIPYQPPPEPTEEEIAEWERELGRELAEDELEHRLAERTGTPEYMAGLSFLLRDVWAEVERMEEASDRMRDALGSADVEITREMSTLFDRLEKSLNEVDSFRTPHAKGRLGPEHTEELQAAWAGLRGAARGTLLRRGKLSVASPYLASGEWLLGALRVTTESPGDASLVRKLKAAGLSFCAFADRPEGAKGGARGKAWTSKNWKLSSEGGFVVLRAAEVGSHYPALCLGVPPDGIPADAAGGYEAVDLAQEAGGIAVMCEAPGDLRELPVELSKVLGIDAPVDAWERLLRRGRRLILFPGTKLEAGALPKRSLSERAMLVGVLAQSLTEEAILSALRRGSFYSTTATGPRITGVEVKSDTVTIRAAEPCQLLFRGETGAVLSGGFGTEASYRFTGGERYVRAVALADVLEDGFRLEATTQAFYLSDELPASPEGETEAGWTIAEPVERSLEAPEAAAEKEIGLEGEQKIEEATEEEAEQEETAEEVEQSEEAQEPGEAKEPQEADESEEPKEPEEPQEPDESEEPEEPEKPQETEVADDTEQIEEEDPTPGEAEEGPTE